MKKLKLTINTEVGEVLTREELKLVYGGLEGSSFGAPGTLKEYKCRIRLQSGKSFVEDYKDNNAKNAQEACEKFCNSLNNVYTVDRCIDGVPA